MLAGATGRRAWHPRGRSSTGARSWRRSTEPGRRGELRRRYGSRRRGHAEEHTEVRLERTRQAYSLLPIPWTHTLCKIQITFIGLLATLTYSKSSPQVRLEINEISDENRVEVMIFAPSCLTNLQELAMHRCPLLVLTDLKMLTSLKKLSVQSCKIVSGALGDSEWQLPIESCKISMCDVSGKALTQLLGRLTRLRELEIFFCDKITLLDVVDEKQQISSSSAEETEVTQATDIHQRIAIEEDEIGGELLLLPSHFADCLQKLVIRGDLIMIAPTTLHALRSLLSLTCPSTYYSSPRCPFPSSLQELDLGRDGCMGTSERLSNLTSLTKLEIGGDELRSEGLWHLLTVGQLSELNINKSPNFIVDGFPHQDEQEQLLLSRSSKLHKFSSYGFEGFLRPPICRVLSFSLTILSFSCCGKAEGLTKEQEDALQLLTSLQELEFTFSFMMRNLPEVLNNLTSLKKLRIHNFPAIGCLPKDGLPSSLQILDVNHCGNAELKEQCMQLRGTIPEIRA